MWIGLDECSETGRMCTSFKLWAGAWRRYFSWSNCSTKPQTSISLSWYLGFWEEWLVTPTFFVSVLGWMCVSYQWWAGPSRLTTLKPTYTITAWHTHWEVILPRHASGNQCHSTSWAANPATLVQKQIFPAVWFLDYSSLFSHYAPLCVVKRWEGGSKQTLDLSSGVISSLAKRRPAITCPHVSIWCQLLDGSDVWIRCSGFGLKKNIDGTPQ